ncbi:hypothetical protein HNY73_012890 [Argiope bruennichi]|uniref:Uncharacterized protein n=1 Tax=Argiope bruennichi TaxID=94029 RepID=A0A8T0EWB4_ARGBR|nr:hypothetical protein HNY73_012890 [Argiope bruennichi]
MVVYVEFETTTAPVSSFRDPVANTTVEFLMDDAPIVKSVSSLVEGRQKPKNKSSAENLHSFVSSIKEDPVKGERSVMLGKILDKRRR